jgi:hypothetical protein
MTSIPRTSTTKAETKHTNTKHANMLQQDEVGQQRQQCLTMS